MTYAYHLLPENLRTSWSRISITYSKRKVHLYIGHVSECGISYKQDGKDTIVKWRETEVSVADNDFVTVFCKDLKQILLDQKSIMRYFGVKYDEFLYPSVSERIEIDDGYRKEHLDPIGYRIFRFLSQFLSEKNEILKTEILTLGATEIEQVLSVLPFFDLKTLVKLDLLSRFSGGALSQLLLSDYWNQPGRQGFWIWAKVEELTGEDLKAVKKIFFKFLYIDQIRLSYTKVDESQFLIDFGEPIPEQGFNGAVDQLLQIPGTDGDLLIYHRTSTTISFSRFSTKAKIAEEVPDAHDEESLTRPDTPVDACLARKVLENPLIMKYVLEHLQLMEITILRKVSAGIRSSVDTAKPDGSIKYISIHMENTNMYNLSLNDGEEKITLYYWRNENGCVVERHKNGVRQLKVELDEDHEVIFRNDFQQMIRFQNSVILIFYFDFSYSSYFLNVCKHHGTPDYQLLNSKTQGLLSVFEELLKVRSQKLLKVNILKITTIREAELMEILSWLDPAHLTTIHLAYRNELHVETKEEPLHKVVFPGDDSFPTTIEIEKVQEMEQWKAAKQLYIFGYGIVTAVEKMKFSNFNKGRITVHSMSSEDMVHLKEDFLKSTSLEKFFIFFKDCTIDDGIMYNLLGSPFRITSNTRIWYFRYPDKDNFLHVRLIVSSRVIFSRVSLSKVPDEVVVMENGIQ